MVRGLLRRQRLQELLVEHPQHLREVVAAFEDLVAGGDHRILDLAGAQGGTFLYPVKRHLAGAAVNREHRRVVEKIKRVVAPLAGRNHAAVYREYLVKFTAI